MFLAYEDIFVTNAFTNFKDLLRDVSYSPMMAEMLSYLGSASALYALRREGRVSRPDENFAREIMQLFTIGTSFRNNDCLVSYLHFISNLMSQIFHFYFIIKVYIN